jgi:hypothetical protein
MRGSRVQGFAGRPVLTRWSGGQTARLASIGSARWSVLVALPHHVAAATLLRHHASIGVRG